jgi:hypothetical protein
MGAPEPHLPWEPEATTPSPPRLSEEELRTRIHMSWYYAGYYTALLEQQYPASVLSVPGSSAEGGEEVPPCP